MGSDESIPKELDNITIGVLLSSDMDLQKLAMRLCGLLQEGVVNRENLNRIRIVLNALSISAYVRNESRKAAIDASFKRALSVYDEFVQRGKRMGKVDIDFVDMYVRKPLIPQNAERRDIIDADNELIRYYDMIRRDYEKHKKEHEKEHKTEYKKEHMIEDIDFVGTFKLLASRDILGRRSPLLHKWDLDKYDSLRRPNKPELWEFLMREYDWYNDARSPPFKRLLSMLSHVLDDSVMSTPILLAKLKEKGLIDIRYRASTCPIKFIPAELFRTAETEKNRNEIMQLCIRYENAFGSIGGRVPSSTYNYMNRKPYEMLRDILDYCQLFPTDVHYLVFSYFMAYSTDDTVRRVLQDVIYETTIEGVSSLVQLLYCNPREAVSLFDITYRVMQHFLNGKPITTCKFKRIRFVGIVNDETVQSQSGLPGIVFHRMVNLARKSMSSRTVIDADILLTERDRRSRSVDVNALLSMFDTDILHIVHRSTIARSINGLYEDCTPRYIPHDSHDRTRTADLVVSLPLAWDEHALSTKTMLGLSITYRQPIYAANKYILDRFAFRQGVQAFSLTAPPFIYDNFDHWLLQVMYTLAKQYGSFYSAQTTSSNDLENGGCFIDWQLHLERVSKTNPIREKEFTTLMSNILGIEMIPSRWLEFKETATPVRLNEREFTRPDIVHAPSEVTMDTLQQNMTMNHEDAPLVMSTVQPKVSTVKDEDDIPSRRPASQRVIKPKIATTNDVQVYTMRRPDEPDSTNFDFIFSYKRVRLNQVELKIYEESRIFVFAACRASARNLAALTTRFPFMTDIASTLPVRGVNLNHEDGTINFDIPEFINTGISSTGEPNQYRVYVRYSPMSHDFSEILMRLAGDKRPIEYSTWNTALAAFKQKHERDAIIHHHDMIYESLYRLNARPEEPTTTEGPTVFGEIKFPAIERRKRPDGTLEQPDIDFSKSPSSLLFGGKPKHTISWIICSCLLALAIIIIIGIICKHTSKESYKHIRIQECS